MSKILGGVLGVIVIGGMAFVLFASILAAADSQVSAAGESGESCAAPPSSASPTQGSCSLSSAEGAAVAAAALAIAQHLEGNPDAWYDTELPQAVLSYWASACPSGSACWGDWQQGNLQCVMLVTAAYTLAGFPLPATGNAIDFWSLYAHRTGWVEFPSARGLPQAGDIMVWSDPPLVGHVAIVLGVEQPMDGHNGAVTFAEANGPASLVTETLLPDLTVVTWSTYTVLGYIRPAPAATRTNTLPALAGSMHSQFSSPKQGASL